MYFFTADEHYGHANIIKYCNRPFKTTEEMNNHIIECHNKLVCDLDTVIHAGDFTLGFKSFANNIKEKLNGSHIFLHGSHDYWLKKNKFSDQIWEKKIEGEYIIVCHYAMRTWARSHYNSWQLYRHSHGTLKPIGKQLDIGVDTNNFYPYSFESIKKIMSTRPDNPNFIPNNKR